ncbi:hypothetical protein M9435_002135 [Picochlorum sp. BPE23]|nr:hypothetical protein M9435_002135 [Picochlorum sp. BPE23]
MTRRRLVYVAVGVAGSSIGLYSYFKRDPLAERSQSGSISPNESVHVAPDARDDQVEQPATRLKKPVRQRLKEFIQRRRHQHLFPFGRHGRAKGSPKPGESQVPLPPTADIMKSHKDVVDQIRTSAERMVDGPLLPRFDDVEIARYALHYGMLRTTNKEGMALVIQDAAHGIADSQSWFLNHTFESIENVMKYSDLIWWDIVDGNPTLHVEIGKAVHVCTGDRAVEFANVVITMMELAALNSALTALDGPIDRINVEMYAKGTNVLNASSAFWILRSVVKTVSHHYPGRLHQLVLYDLPGILNWIILGVKKLVHEDTARKVLSRESHHSKTK